MIPAACPSHLWYLLHHPFLFCHAHDQRLHSILHDLGRYYCSLLLHLWHLLPPHHVLPIVYIKAWNHFGASVPSNFDRAKVSDLSMRSWYVDFVGGVHAWRSDYTCKACAPMQSLGQSPGVTDLAEARSAWPARVLIPTWNQEQGRTNVAIKILCMNDESFIMKVGLRIGGLLLGDLTQKSSS
jgi:hypothetical protein